MKGIAYLYNVGRRIVVRPNCEMEVHLLIVSGMIQFPRSNELARGRSFWVVTSALRGEPEVTFRCQHRLDPEPDHGAPAPQSINPVMDGRFERVSDPDISDVAQPCYFGANAGPLSPRKSPRPDIWLEKSCVRGGS
jgi:hypothetical protein